jgi:hypothetical protein
VFKTVTQVIRIRHGVDLFCILIISGAICYANKLHEEKSMSEQIKETQCCPKFNPAPWDGKIFNWDNKIFVKDKVLTFFYIPINFGSVIKRIMKKVEQNGIKMTEWLGLSDHISKWSMDIYVAVDKEVTGANNVALSGKFMKVHIKILVNGGRTLSNWRMGKI